MSFINVTCPECGTERKINGRGTCQRCGAYLVHHWTAMHLGAPLPTPDPAQTWLLRHGAWLRATDRRPSSPPPVRCKTCARAWEPSLADWERGAITVCPECILAAATAHLRSYGPDGVTYVEHPTIIGGYPGWDESLADEEAWARQQEEIAS